jgi:hypothetical protein
MHSDRCYELKYKMWPTPSKAVCELWLIQVELADQVWTMVAEEA